MSSRIRSGVSPLSWTNDALPDLGDYISLETCLKQAASADYQGIELSPVSTPPPLHEAGLQIASGWHKGFLAERSVAEEIAAAESHA